MPGGRTQIVQVTDGGYEFLFDLGGERVVAAFGAARKSPAARDTSRQAGFLGKETSSRQLEKIQAAAPTPEAGRRRAHLAGLSFRDRFFETHGDRYDRGHFMSHRQGGGLDINLFPQLTAVSQPLSMVGKQYRSMEAACVANPGTFCFSRPIYDDGTWVPALIEYGLLFGPSNTPTQVFPNK